MGKAEELLMTSAYSTRDIGSGYAEEHIVIGRDRVIIIPDSIQKIGVQFDHNIETVTFDCPRFWDKHDMSTMKIYINYMRSDGHVGMHLCSNIVAEDDIMHFDWTISGDVTTIQGYLSFLVCIKRVDEEGNEAQHWNSMLNKELYIAEGLECQETILAQYPDIVTQVLTRMDIVEAEQQRWENATEEELAQWKSTMEQLYAIWTADNEQAMSTWQGNMEQNQSTWQTTNEQAMSTWKTNTYKELDDRMNVAEGNTTPDAIANQINDALDNNEATQAVISETVTEFLHDDVTVPAMIKEVVDNYLVENPPKVDTDETLSIAGDAADAKAVGDALKDHDTVTTTDQTLVGSVEGPLALVELAGNTEQQTLSGKNLVPYPHTWTSKEDQGITWTDNGDGTWTANGTATGNSYIRLANYTNDGWFLPAGTYIYSAEIEGTGGALGIDRCNMDGTYANRYVANTNVASTFTIPEEDVGVYYPRLLICVPSGVTVNNLTFKPMLRLASITDDTWEPYIGGVEMKQGRYSYENGAFQSSSNDVCTNRTIPCKSDDKIKLTTEKTSRIMVLFYIDGGYLSYTEGNNTNSIEAVAPSGTTSFHIRIQNATENITPLTAGKISLTVNGKPIYIRPSYVEMIPGYYAPSNNGVYTPTTKGSICCDRSIPCKEGDVLKTYLPRENDLYYLFYMDDAYVNSYHQPLSATHGFTVQSGVNNFKFYVMETGTTPAEYGNISLTINDAVIDVRTTPYVIPASPNPYYPQVIENTFDGDVEMIQGTYQSDGNIKNSSYYVSSKRKIPCKSGDTIGLIHNNASAKVFFFNNGAYLSNTTITDTVTVPGGATEFAFSINGSDNITPETVGKITLTVNGKYVGQIVEYGKNLFDEVALFKNIALNSGYYYDKASKFCDSINGKLLLDYKENSQYTIALICRTDSTSSNVRFTINYSDGSRESMSIGNNTTDKLRTHITQQGKTVSDILLAYSSNDNVYLKDVLIYEGAIENPIYEPYTETVTTFFLNEPLRKEDILLREDELLKVKRKIKKWVFDGTETWGSGFSTKLNKLAFSLTDNFKADKTDLKNVGKGLCNYFGYNSIGGDVANTVRFSGGTTDNVVWFYPLDFETVDEWKTWLAERYDNGNPVTMEYALATPEIEVLGTASQKALNDLVSFNDVTHIDILSKIQPSGIKTTFPITEAGALIIKAPIQHAELENDISAVATKLESISAVYVGTAEPDPSNVIENAVYIRIIE